MKSAIQNFVTAFVPFENGKVRTWSELSTKVPSTFASLNPRIKSYSEDAEAWLLSLPHGADDKGTLIIRNNEGTVNVPSAEEKRAGKKLTVGEDTRVTSEYQLTLKALRDLVALSKLIECTIEPERGRTASSDNSDGFID